jgi:hypothetical protein
MYSQLFKIHEKLIDLPVVFLELLEMLLFIARIIRSLISYPKLMYAPYFVQEYLGVFTSFFISSKTPSYPYHRWSVLTLAVEYFRTLLL